jgi:tRNA threonylcarbamoyl adenosine modification protein YjeE
LAVFVYTAFSVAETMDLGASLGRELARGDVVLLSGDLGAGKTQFVKGVAQGLGVACPVTSPTFNLMLEYELPDGRLLRHFDLYRIDSSKQLDDIDYFGCLESGALCLVEWGDKFADAMPLDWLGIDVLIRSCDRPCDGTLPEGHDPADAVALDGQVRTFYAEAHGPRADQLLRSWKTSFEVKHLL